MATVIGSKGLSFTTFPLVVEDHAGGFNLRPLPETLSFRKMAQRRIATDRVELPFRAANLGISAQITISIAGKKWLLLVGQERQDGFILKLPSGYVSASQIMSPEHTLAQELAEEILLESGDRFLRTTLNSKLLPAAYPSLQYTNSTLDFSFGNTDWFGFESSQPYVNQEELPGQPDFYLHQPTSSIQLVYRLTLDNPEILHTGTLFHAEEQLARNGLLNICKNQQIWLMAEDGRQGLYQLVEGELQPFRPTDSLVFSEVFGPRRVERGLTIVQASNTVSPDSGFSPQYGS